MVGHSETSPWPQAIQFSSLKMLIAHVFCSFSCVSKWGKMSYVSTALFPNLLWCFLPLWRLCLTGGLSVWLNSVCVNHLSNKDTFYVCLLRSSISCDVINLGFRAMAGFPSHRRSTLSWNRIAFSSKWFVVCLLVSSSSRAVASWSGKWDSGVE